MLGTWALWVRFLGDSPWLRVHTRGSRFIEPARGSGMVVLWYGFQHLKAPSIPRDSNVVPFWLWLLFFLGVIIY